MRLLADFRIIGKVHPEYVEIVVDLKLGLTQKRSEGPAFVSLYLLAYLVNERFFHARTRKKSFSFFRHYLSLFLMFLHYLLVFK